MLIKIYDLYNYIFFLNIILNKKNVCYNYLDGRE